MNAELEQLERRMTQITASAGAEPLGGEDAELRLGWLALGEALRRADADRPMPALRMPPAVPAVLPAPAGARRTYRHLAAAVAAAALVASLLMALTVPTARQTGLPGDSVGASDLGPWTEAIDAEIASAREAAREARTSMAISSASDHIQYQMEILQKDLDSSPW